ncbi:peptidase domain-containing ABC transporter [Flavobacterium sp. ST-75]|uniref:Peptidase domain-containing ABC transporter n=1 Tax=Flavobacterium rhizophilum TaxID=3163296 RepID=A0ABW8YGW8_9FLAO
MIKFIPQRDQMDCGPACLVMVANFYGKKYNLDYVRKKSFITKEGVSFSGLKEAAQDIGFETLSTQLTIKQLIDKNEYFPCILHWNQKHFVVLYKVKPTKGKNYFYIADPEFGKIKLSEDKFTSHWQSNSNYGVALFLNPANKFYELNPEPETTINFKYILNYIKPHKYKFFKIFLLLLAGSGFTVFFPLITQKLIDDGIRTKNLNLIILLLLGQLALYIGVIVVGIFRNWLMLYVGNKVSITIISDFFKKMMKLPMSFFDTKMIGDFQQRIQDNEHIEDFLTSNSLITLFSFITFSVFFAILMYYDYKILLVYLTLTVGSVVWSYYWLNKRKMLDYIRFQQRVENQESVYEMLNGITEMKLNRFETYKITAWEKIQKQLFDINLRILRLDQVQLSGFEFLNQTKNIIVTFIAAIAVTNNTLTLGELLSISYIIGQMNGPVNQIITFLRSFQDAKLSLLRLNEVKNHDDEETKNLKLLNTNSIHNSNVYNGISIKNLSFQYEGPKSPYVLRNINLLIPEGKVTAIVGASGSGKTTLMKLLLKFYNPTNGTIFYNGDDLLNLSPGSLREKCGVVMQDGFIFSDTIARNIATGDDKFDYNKLKHAAVMANIDDFIMSLPLKYNTKIGAAGNGISGGQKQRLLIARAIYKAPQYIFFDEASSALDAENEKIIHDNLQNFFKGKTVIVIAHRLSTVKNADQIIVMNNGEITESGTHESLVKQESNYYNLVKNQLALGT